MSSRPITWRRLGVSAVVLATAAAGLPVLLSTPAHAAAATELRITQDNGRATAAAGTCTAFTVTPFDAVGGRPDAATITVVIGESPAGDTHDVDFCLVDGDSASTADDGSPFVNPPRYDNASQGSTSPTRPTPQEYNAGPSITTSAVDSTAIPPGKSAGTDNPDRASGEDPAITGDSVAPNNNNPSGTDRASFPSDGGPVRFGVVGLLPGAAATIDAFVDADADTNRLSPNGLTAEDNVRATRRTLAFSEGGRPGSTQAADAVRRVILTPEDSFAALSALGVAEHVFSVTLLNGNQDVIGGVTPRVIATAGPNSAGTFTEQCEPTQNEGGPATCLYRPQQAGTDTVTAFVNQTTGARTFGLDPTEPQDSSTATTTKPSVAASEARILQLTPLEASVPAGQSQVFVATVTDGAGAPARDVGVTFFEDGAGRLDAGAAGAGASSTKLDTTDATGRADVTFVTSAGDSGTNTVFASITNPGSTRCQQTTAPAGQCSDSSPVTITAAATPSATPTATISPRPSASASASASTSPRPSTSSTPACATPASVSLDVTTITATGGANVTVRGTANSVVDLFAYSRPSTTYRLVRSGDVGSDGAETYRITPPTNTRLYAQQRGCNASESIVLNVRTQISLNVVRNGVRNYTFSGSLLPARPNGLIASLYRVESDGRQILTAQTRANANVGQPGYDSSRPAGSYTIRRQFTGSGRFGFVVRTGQDLQNAPGSSNVRSLLVF